MRLNPFSRLGFATISLTTFSLAATPTIGVATAVGTFKVNSSSVEGNANVFDGSEIRTGKAPSQVFLRSGSAVTLGTNSSGALYRDHIVLEDGATKVDNMTGYSVHAASYKIQAGQAGSQAVVRFNGGDVEVAALKGSLDVFNGRGVLLTHIGAGTASAFNKDPQAGPNSGPPPNTANRPKEAALYGILAASIAGLGLAVDAIVQPGNSNQMSP